MIKVEKGVPLPPLGMRGGWRKYPFNSMDVGDSFVVEDARVISAASYWARRHPGWSFASRKLPDGRRRIWRLM